MVVVIAAVEARATCDCAEPPPSCATSSTCLEQFHALLPSLWDTAQLDDEMQALSAGFEGVSSIAALLPLLEHPDVRHRNVVAHALGRLRARDAVPALIRHVDDTSQAAWALGVIGDARAVPALLRYVKVSPFADVPARLARVGPLTLAHVLVDPHSRDVARQTATNALQDIDADVDVSEAVDVLRRAIPTADECLDQILNVLQTFGERAAAAVPDVRAVRARVAAHEGVTRTSLALGSSSAVTTMPRIDDVLLALGDASVVVDVAARFQEDPIGVHMQLAPLGAHAAAAIPTFVAALEHGTWSHQADAAHGLGFIGDATAVPALVGALSSRSWVVVFEAARALGRIGVDVGAHAGARLAVLRDEHWSAAVREVADVAVRRVMGEPITEINDEHDDVHQIVADHRAEGEEVHGPVCEVEGDPATMQEPPHRFVFVAGRWIDVSTAEAPVFDDVDPRIATQRLPPSPAPAKVDSMPVDDGTLVGRDGGEWGGDLHFIDRRGLVTKLLDRNVIHLRNVDDVVLAFTGLDHMGMNDGVVLRIERHEGRWRAVPLVALPGAPYEIRTAPESGSVIVLDDHGAVVVDVDGAIEPVPCRLAVPRP